MKKTQRNILLVIVAILILLAFASRFVFRKTTLKNQINSPLACTMEAKICPDGSAVGRTGAHCEFAPCPSVQIPEIWKTARDEKQNLSWRYPELETTYIRAQVWPPVVTIYQGDPSCSNINRNSPLATVDTKIINNQPYCLSFESEGAAGSTYNTYNYRATQNGHLVNLNFTLQYPQCLNYDGPQQGACLTEQKNFDVDKLAGQIISSVEFK